MNSYIPKIIGLGGAALLLSDVFKNGARKANQRTDTDLANRMTDVYVNHQTSPVESPLLETVKGKYRNYLLDSKIVAGFIKAKNAVTAPFGQAAKYALPLGLAAGAIFLPSVAGAACAGLLVAGGLSVLAHHVLGIGKKT